MVQTSFDIMKSISCLNLACLALVITMGGVKCDFKPLEGGIMREAVERLLDLGSRPSGTDFWTVCQQKDHLASCSAKIYGDKYRQLVCKHFLCASRRGRYLGFPSAVSIGQAPNGVDCGTANTPGVCVNGECIDPQNTNIPIIIRRNVDGHGNQKCSVTPEVEKILNA